jgi:hypothetical protein
MGARRNQRNQKGTDGSEKPEGNARDLDGIRKTKGKCTGTGLESEKTKGEWTGTGRNQRNQKGMHGDWKDQRTQKGNGRDLDGVRETRREWTGAPCSPKRTWAENDRRSPSTAFAESLPDSRGTLPIPIYSLIISEPSKPCDLIPTSTSGATAPPSTPG